MYFYFVLGFAKLLTSVSIKIIGENLIGEWLFIFNVNYILYLSQIYLQSDIKYIFINIIYYNLLYFTS